MQFCSHSATGPKLSFSPSVFLLRIVWAGTDLCDSPTLWPLPSCTQIVPNSSSFRKNTRGNYRWKGRLIVLLIRICKCLRNKEQFGLWLPFKLVSWQKSSLVSVLVCYKHLYLCHFTLYVCVCVCFGFCFSHNMGQRLYDPPVWEKWVFNPHTNCTLCIMHYGEQLALNKCTQ